LISHSNVKGTEQKEWGRVDVCDEYSLDLN